MRRPTTTFFDSGIPEVTTPLDPTLARRAARVVAAASADERERAMLLEMLGLDGVERGESCR